MNVPSIPDSTPGNAPNNAGRWAGLGFLVLFVGLAVSCGGLLDNAGGDDAGPSDYEVRRQCERWVADRLKAPSTAEFGNHTVDGGPTSWRVTGTVDAQNSFGAMMQTAWACDIELDGDTWRGRAVLIE